jgi:molybdate transport system ATP-binding protein
VIEASFKGQLGDFTLDAQFTLPSRGVTALFGQSGCGKTTLLRCMAGLTRLRDGYLRVGDETWQDGRQMLPPHKRAVGYVFQEASLFAHLSVRSNLDFARKRARDGGQGPQFDDVVSLLGLRPLLERSPADLSGGERQRVAIGRALLSAPRILLMDEPLSGLDRISKDEIIPYLERLHDQLDIPILLISHDTDEVERLADHLLLMEDGQIQSAGPLLDMLADPTLFIAKSRKTASVLEATVTSFDDKDQLTTLDIAGLPLWVPGFVGASGQKRRVRIAATDVSLARDKPSRTTILNVLPACIVDIHPLDSGRVNVVLGLDNPDGPRVIARISLRSFNSFGFETGQRVYAQVKGVSMVERHSG